MNPDKYCLLYNTPKDILDIMGKGKIEVHKYNNT